MWTITTVDSELMLWCSDGKPILNVARGGSGESTRLIVDRKGFLDITELDVKAPDPGTEYILIDCDLNSTEVQISSPPCAIDANGLKLYQDNKGEPADLLLPLHLEIDPDAATFTLSIISDNQRAGAVISADTTTVKGQLKPLPHISAADAAYFETMMASNIVPFAPDQRGAPGKTQDEIRTLGHRLFPFTPYSFQLAMAIYDWTTASFARMVYVDMFRYTGLDIHIPAKDGGKPVTPIDHEGLTTAIWTSNWGSFTAQNASFMASLLMKPAWSRLEVELQLLHARDDLVRAVEAEDRLLAAAMHSLPRTSTLARPRLFSGQLDMAHLDMESFGIEFVECPANHGPVCRPLRDTLQTALATYLAEGKTITTKVTWSFTDTVEGALHYSNGILLVLDFSTDVASPCVWESVSYVTPLSSDPKKIEYTLPPGSQFRVLSEEDATYNEKRFLVITLQPIYWRIDAGAEGELQTRNGGDAVQG
ncbi:hypothetical protein BJX68DRAFT_268353 [Aspergillus pseudodeflectus]|uniref:Uncharacterized protein n=1 Tax=Aspergillus pseudodeflectus TaxID=176178 RepID=A0ABR4K4U3_9EURO